MLGSYTSLHNVDLGGYKIKKTYMFHAARYFHLKFCGYCEILVNQRWDMLFGKIYKGWSLFIILGTDI